MKPNDTLPSSRTDWDKVKSMADEEIDYTDIPPLDDTFFARARVVLPTSNAQRFVQIDADILDWFKTQSAEYQSLINQALRDYIKSQQP